eukprot:4561861-Prymnesium_polylepis.2
MRRLVLELEDGATMVRRNYTLSRSHATPVILLSCMVTRAPRGTRSWSPVPTRSSRHRRTAPCSSW